MKEKVKKFDAEVSKILDLVINSVYTNKEIFLRELVSNASDACDKLRYESILKTNLVKKDHKYHILLEVNVKNSTISIIDTGVGMNKNDLISNIGTIAKSGTEKFFSNLSTDKKKESELIGQFGIGFYSVFMVADKVTIISKKAGENQSYFWSSEGRGEYVIDESKEAIVCGTKIALRIKNNQKRFLDINEIKKIVTNYSNHISWPIKIIKDEKEEIINTQKALWIKHPSQIKNEEYRSFYNHVLQEQGSPWLVIHNRIEGIIEYINLLFISENKLLSNADNKKTSLQLYTNRVLISKNCSNLLPHYLRFVVGIIDSKDLSLNISRETLQNNKSMEIIKRSLSRRVLESIKSHLSKYKEKQESFINNFGEVIKEGLYNNNIEHEKEIILSFCTFY